MSEGKNGKNNPPQKNPPKQTKAPKQTTKPPVHQSGHNTTDAKATTPHLPLADWCPAILWVTATMKKLLLLQFSCRTWLDRICFLVHLVCCLGYLLPVPWAPQHAPWDRRQWEGQSSSAGAVWALFGPSWNTSVLPALLWSHREHTAPYGLLWRILAASKPDLVQMSRTYGIY